MIVSLDWPAILRKFAELYHWHPNTVLDETPCCRLWPFLFPNGVRRPYDPERVKNEINRRRAAKGLPPMKPAKHHNA